MSEKIKVVIEVPKDQYEWIKEHKGETDYQTTKMLYNCVRSGTLFDKAEGCWISSYPDVEPNPMFMYGTCSVCGFEQSISNKLNYCPNCGAKMESEEEEFDDNLDEMLEKLWNDAESEVEQ